MKTLREKRLSILPPNFRNCRLETLEAMPALHSEQSNVVAEIKKNPGGNFFLAGDFGTGKTYLLWTLYRYAVEQDTRRVIACTLSELLTEYKNFIQASIKGDPLIYPRISAEDLRQTHTKYSIFIDDIDKARPTEYTAEQLFELADAIYSYQHQVVVTTNLTLEKLVAHFKRADERFGGAIVRRLVDKAYICEMF